MSKRGDLVWGKLKSYSWWPAVVIDPEDCGRDRTTNNKLWIFWFGDHKVSEVDCKRIVDFKQYFTEKYAQKLGKHLKFAIQETLIICAEIDKFKYQDPSSLFRWANLGFKSSSSVSLNRKRKLSELPDIVLEALKKDEFKRICQSESDSESGSDDEIDGTLENVRKGSKDLEEICVVCCSSEFKIAMQHPIFIGSVCQKCKKIVSKITKIQLGKLQDICFVCGDGGSLVYCSFNQCFCSYCKLCIDYLAPTGSYTKILKNDDWRCYLCEPVCDTQCLIQKRGQNLSKIVCTPLFPKEKLPIRVIANTNSALSVLKEKRMIIEVYYTESSKYLQSSDLRCFEYYSDFSQKEFAEIRADLVCGSYFVNSTDLQDKKKCVVSLSSAFFRFLFRLDCAQIYKPLVFFIFVSDAEVMDGIITSLVLRYLKVQPLSIQLGKKNFLIWSNMPNLNGGTSHKFLAREAKDNKPVEEKILSKFMDSLKYYFKQMP